MTTRRLRPRIAAALAVATGAAVLAGCGGAGGDTLNWYINPDGQETLGQLAEQCSTEDYTIAVQLLPASATDQRTQLARRLAASDSSIDLMSLDPVFVPEFANANWLEPMPEEVAGRVLDDDVLEGAAESVRWNDQVYAAPQWANTQVLWYRKSLAEAAGLDMSQPVTWEQVIDAAADNDGTVGVQANQYEGYMVWINALVMGAGGEVVSDPEAGREAQVDLDSDAGRAAAAVVEQLAASPARQEDFVTSNEGTSLGLMFGDRAGAGEFMVNWTFVYGNYSGEDDFEDLGWARYPQTVEGEDSRPPVGGINIGVSAFSANTDWAVEAAECVTTSEAQEALAVNESLMPARASAYDSEALQEAFPPDLLELFRTSVDEGGPRPKSAYYAMISSAVQAVWHSPTAVNENTPAESATFLREVLEGTRIL